MNCLNCGTEMITNEVTTKKSSVEELKKVWTGGPESSLEDLRDALDAASAMVNATIFEHPKLFGKLQASYRIGWV